jgi:hypothetical protein
MNFARRFLVTVSINKKRLPRLMSGGGFEKIAVNIFCSSVPIYTVQLAQLFSSTTLKILSIVPLDCDHNISRQ